MKTPPVCDYEGSDYQEKFWGAGGRAYEDAAEALALKNLLPKNGKHLLELGAGAGRNTLRYAGFERVTLLDYSTTQLEQAIEKLGEGPGYRYIAADIYRLPFAPSTFDAATMIRTLHHFAQPQLALAAGARLPGWRGVLYPGICQQKEYKISPALCSRKTEMESFQPRSCGICGTQFRFPPRRCQGNALGVRL